MYFNFNINYTDPIQIQTLKTGTDSIRRLVSY
jgi:hypothetical protein